MIVSSSRRSSATAVTIAFFYLAAIGLSLAPLPSWLKPTDLFEEEDPIGAFFAAVLAKPESIPLPDQQVDQAQASGNPLIEAEGEELDELPDPSSSARDQRAQTVHVRRGAWVMPERPNFDKAAKRLGLKASPLVRPCLPSASKQGGGCSYRALDRFFAALGRAEAGASDAGPVRIVLFGDSLTASDRITNRARYRLQQRFGSAGRGFLMAKRINQLQLGRHTGRGSRGWSLDIITSSLSKLPDRHFGFSGASFTAQGPGETLTYTRLGSSRYLKLFYYAYAGGGEIELRVDDQPYSRWNTFAPVESGAFASFVLPSGARKLSIRSLNKGARIYGVSLETEAPGVILSTLGLPGATSEVWLRPQEDEFARLLSQHAPNLAVLMVGGNDGFMLAKKRTTRETIAKDTRAVLKRIRRAVPTADCLLITPLEAARKKGGGRLIPKPEVRVVIRTLRQIAKTEGCGLFDMYASMGGRGSLKRWVAARLMQGDLIHPRDAGSNFLGEMLAEAIMKAYDESGSAPLPAGDAPDEGVP